MPSSAIGFSYAYDALSRLAGVTNSMLAAPNVTAYHYDGVGNLDYFTYPNGVKHAYTYDERNRLKLLRVAGGYGALLHGYGYELGPTGRRTGVTETNRVGSTETFRRRVGYEYDTALDPSSTVKPL